MWVYMGSRGTAPLIPNFSTVLRRVVNFMSQPLCPWKRTPVPNEWEATLPWLQPAWNRTFYWYIMNIFCLGVLSKKVCNCSIKNIHNVINKHIYLTFSFMFSTKMEESTRQLFAWIITKEKRKIGTCFLERQEAVHLFWPTQIPQNCSKTK